MEHGIKFKTNNVLYTRKYKKNTKQINQMEYTYILVSTRTLKRGSYKQIRAKVSCYSRRLR